MKTMFKRIASLLFAILCIVSIIPTSVFALPIDSCEDEPNIVCESTELIKPVDVIEETVKPEDISDELLIQTSTPDMIVYADENGWPILVETGEGFNFKHYGTYHTDEWRWTYYTSKIKYTYHYRTKEWYACDDGIYRTSDGYIVLASQHHEKGTILDTPFGKGIVLDWCGTKGSIDIYTHY